MPFTLGRSAVLTHTVGEDDLATRWQNDVDVLATPVLLWLAEIACMRAIEPELPQGSMTVGVEHRLQHVAPTPVGFDIRLQATLMKATERRLIFEVEGHDGHEVILKGNHERGVVDAGKFKTRVADKAMQADQGLGVDEVVPAQGR